ncbi:MAG: hypothetical protein KAT90_10330 [Gammaproteobacteria bacterium]|nr:hypothetical protein [Gammaproteobacteria bacterium]
MKTPNINEFEIDAKLLRGAQLCQGKCDVRYYLNGICLSKTGYVYGTNGSVLFRAALPDDVKKEIKENWILDIESAIPESAITAKIEFLSDKKGIITLYKGGLLNRDEYKHIYFKVIDGKYPEVDKMLSDIVEKREPVCHICINPDYIVTAHKVFKKAIGFVLNFAGSSSAIHINTSHPSFDSVEMLIMPMRE